MAERQIPVGLCAVCGRALTIRVDGKTRMHKALSRSGFLTADRCPGGGQEPRQKGGDRG